MTTPSEEERDQRVIPIQQYAESARAELAKLQSASYEAFQQQKPGEGDPDCSSCNGFLYVERGGHIVDCDSCDGTGKESMVKFNTEWFAEAVIEIMTNDLFFSAEDAVIGKTSVELYPKSDEEQNSSSFFTSEISSDDQVKNLLDD